MQGHNIGIAQHIGHGRHIAEADVLRGFQVGMEGPGQHRHANASAELCHAQANGSGADDPEGFATDLREHATHPGAAFDLRVEAWHFACDGQ